MTLRGRIYLRLQHADADETDVVGALALFETAGTRRCASAGRAASSP